MPNGRCRLHGGKTPKGQQNALKHGIYSAGLSEEERALFIEMPVGTVDHELHMARIQLRRALETSRNEVVARPGRRPDPTLSGIIDRFLGRIGHLEKQRMELIQGLGEPEEVPEIGAVVDGRQQVDPQLQLPVDQMLKAANWIESVCYELKIREPTQLVTWCRGEGWEEVES